MSIKHMVIKYCSKCGEDKSPEQFYKRTRSSDGLNPHCKACVSAAEKEYRTPEMNRRYNLKKTFGLTVEQYDAMLAEQGGVCAICKKAETTVRQGAVQSLSVDHCHTTNKIRGLLCNSCNRALGKFRDSIDLLKNAQLYLERYL